MSQYKLSKINIVPKYKSCILQLELVVLAGFLCFADLHVPGNCKLCFADLHVSVTWQSSNFDILFTICFVDRLLLWELGMNRSFNNSSINTHWLLPSNAWLQGICIHINLNLSHLLRKKSEVFSNKREEEE